MLQISYSKEKTAAHGPVIFIDRDGVINKRRPDDYVLNFAHFEFVPGIRAALQQLAALRLPMILISNQAAVGKGLLTQTALEEISERMRQILADDGTVLAAAYYCPHRRDENCACRKPKPGLLLRAAEDFKVDMERSIFIGDSESDVLAARAAACRPILFSPEARNLSVRPTWMTQLTIATSPDELVDIAVRCLSGELAVPQPSK
jgi:D-glycero-D-manno-heptose 1,7-bisphosphate phosphatase